MSSVLALPTEITLDGCDVQQLVELADTFHELDLDFSHHEKMTSARLANDKADWAMLGQHLTCAYQALSQEQPESVYQALKAIEHLLARRGVLVASPEPPTQPSQPLPQETEFDYGH